jgi:AcrR family transcriptional regulator
LTISKGTRPARDRSAKSAGPQRGPQKRSKRTRQAILEAALRVIARRGVGASTFREVANDAEVSLGVVTYHFPNRRDLLTAAFALHLETTDQRGSSFSEEHGRALREKLRSGESIADAVVELLRSLVEDERDSFIASHELTLELTRDSELALSVKSALTAHRTIVAQMVAAAGSEDAELDGEILSAAFEGLALKWLAHPGDAQFEARLRRVVARLMSKFDVRR